MTSSRAPRTIWTDDEITTLLALFNEKKLSDLLDSKGQKSKDIFMDLERCLKEQGLTWTWEQIRTCWKNLKKRFTAERLLLCKSGGEPSKWKWFDKMSLLLGDRPMVQARDYGVDTAAEDEDIVLLCGDHAAQKFRTMRTKYQDLKRMNDASRYYGKYVGRPRWRYYDLMDEFLRGNEDTPNPAPSETPVMVISNICSVAEQAPAVAGTHGEGLIDPEVRIKQEPQHDEEVSWDANDSVEDQLDGESSGGNQAPGRVHDWKATPEDTADASMASTSAPPVAAGSQQDAFHYFGMMVADRLRRLPRGVSLRALNAMHQVLFEHEMAADS